MKPNRKLKKPKSFPKLVLGHVIGLTTKNANGFDSNEYSNIYVYIAGCVVVVCDVGTSGSQSSLVVANGTPKPLSCVSVSKDGRFVAAGESGHQAAVLVWDCISSVLLSELKSHQHGVECIAFSPDGKLLVSIGIPNDGYICLWDLGNGILVSRLKACPPCSSVESVCFSSDGNFIVTAGIKQLKIWKLISSARTRSNMGVKSLSMHGKPINLGNQKGCSFIAVKSLILFDDNVVNFGQACENSPVYGLTDTGVLCVIYGSTIKKSVDIKVRKAFALSPSNKIIACACNNGVVKLFTTDSLNYSGILRHDEWKKCKEQDDIDSHSESFINDIKLPTLPHAIACEFSNSDKLVVVYGDNSIYLWDIRDLQKATSRQVLVSHSGYISDIKCLPCENMNNQSLKCVSGGCLSFATCSEDGTIRLWNINILQNVSFLSDQTLVTNMKAKLTTAIKPIYTASSEIFEPESEKIVVNAPGFCSMAISSDGKYMALSDMAIESTTDVIVTVQDKKVNIFSTDTGKFIRSFKQGGDFGEAVKVIVDESSSFLVCSYSDRSICIYDIMTGEIIARAGGHSEIITGIILLPDCQHIVSVSGDSCIFVWRLPTIMSSKMLQKKKEKSLSLSPRSTMMPQIEFLEDTQQFKINTEEFKQIESSTPVTRGFSYQGDGLQEVSVFKFSISRLPKWAQARAINPVVNPGYDPSQKNEIISSVGSHDCSNPHTPSKHEQDSGRLVLDSISRFSSKNTSKGSQSPQKPHRMSFALDGRWLTIYTVCLDSPTLGSEVPDPAQAIINVNSSCMKHSDKHNLNPDLSLSARTKTEKRESATKRSSLTCFAGGQKNLTDTSIMNPLCENMIQEINLKQCEEQNTIVACKEALLDMEKAVNNAFHLFNKLKNLKADVSGLYGQAAEILPSIGLKVHEVTKMVQFSKEQCGKTDEDILSFDPLLEVNTENCSEKSY